MNIIRLTYPIPATNQAQLTSFLSRAKFSLCPISGFQLRQVYRTQQHSWHPRTSHIPHRKDGSCSEQQMATARLWLQNAKDIIRNRLSKRRLHRAPPPTAAAASTGEGCYTRFRLACVLGQQAESQCRAVCDPGEGRGKEELPPSDLRVVARSVITDGIGPSKGLAPPAPGSQTVSLPMYPPHSTGPVGRLHDI